MQHFARIIAVLALVAAGCEHKAPPAQRGPMGSASGTPSAAPSPGSGDQKPEPVGRAPEPLPAPPEGVRPPTAQDLDAYTKFLKGTGKLAATIDTSLGTIHCELFGDKAPVAVANFVGLATGQKAWRDPKTGNIENGKPYFDGVICHRVIPGFMMQCGDPTGTGTGGPGYTFDNEIDRTLQMKPGTLAMANAGTNPETGGGTNGSQFFIMEGSKPELVGGYTIFGQCKEVDVVAKVTHTPVMCATTETNPCTPDTADRPKDAVVLKKITITRE
jgi:peptidyl-prolyl cis-trans isomerase A (cyclophilin A)